MSDNPKHICYDCDHKGRYTTTEYHKVNVEFYCILTGKPIPKQIEYDECRNRRVDGKRKKRKGVQPTL